jgi:hypothetical protein
MNAKEMRIAIAEARRWKYVDNLPGYPRGIDPNGVTHELPDYLNDLNAMHDAEKILSPKEFECYRWTLWSQCKRALFTESHRAYLHATAAQRAEAFLKTLNLWTDGN